MLNQLCIPRINFTWSDLLSFLYTVAFHLVNLLNMLFKANTPTFRKITQFIRCKKLFVFCIL